jgi:ribosomal protein L24
VKVQGVRLQTHYSKGDGVATGGLNKKEGWIHISNVSHMTESGKSTKVRRVRSENGVNIFSKKTNEPVRIKKEKTISKVKLEEDTVKKEKEKIKKDKFTFIAM